jgi:poly(hydroxyalkanoate) depolymerase family esterase
MTGLKDTLAGLAGLRSRFERLLGSAKRAETGTPVAAGDLHEVAGFGSNPGNLRMLAYVPRSRPKSPALVVALHGCTQSAAVYNHGSGWSALAETNGFVVLFPEQQRTNNPNLCFNWFAPGDVTRDQGEVLSIRQMVDRMVADHGIDRGRVFVVGLSAGGAMSAALLATYPEVFAGGAIIAGLPYGSATNVQGAFEAMSRGREQTARDWGNLIRSASPHRGPWPRISVWHGSADSVVNAKNMDDALEQWGDLHGLSAAPRIESLGSGVSRRVWSTQAGDNVIEAITIDGMGHGVPLATGSGSERAGNAGAFHLDVGVSSSHHIVRFWGLENKRASALARAEAKDHAAANPAPIVLEPRVPLMAARADASSEGKLNGNESRPAAHDPHGVIAAALQAAGILGSGAATGDRAGPLDPSGVITAALRSAGILKK